MCPQNVVHVVHLEELFDYLGAESITRSSVVDLVDPGRKSDRRTEAISQTLPFLRLDLTILDLP